MKRLLSVPASVPSVYSCANTGLHLDARLARLHPLRLVLGGARFARDLARRAGCTSCVVWCEQVEAWALRAGTVTCEIARDAGCGETLVDEVARDGVITPAEAAQLRRQFGEIATEAVEGRVV